MSGAGLEGKEKAKQCFPRRRDAQQSQGAGTWLSTHRGGDLAAEPAWTWNQAVLSEGGQNSRWRHRRKEAPKPALLAGVGASAGEAAGNSYTQGGVEKFSGPLQPPCPVRQARARCGSSRIKPTPDFKDLVEKKTVTTILTN